MIRNIIALCAVTLVFAGALSAEEQQAQKGSGLSSWLKSMQKKLDIVSPRKTLSVSTGVAGVRGAKEDAKPKLYWKGKKGDEQVSEEELNEFKEGLAFAEAGDAEKAVHEFEEFMKLYPDSALIPDVKKTLDMVKAEAKAKPKAEPKAETKAEPNVETPAEPKAEPKAEPQAATKAEPKTEAK